MPARLCCCTVHQQQLGRTYKHLVAVQACELPLGHSSQPFVLCGGYFRHLQKLEVSKVRKSLACISLWLQWVVSRFTM